MSKIVSDKTAIYLTDGGTLPVAVNIVAISTASPAVVQVASTAGITDLDPILVEGSGRADLDGKWWQADLVDGTHVALLASEAGAAVGAVGTIQALAMGTVLIKACESTVTLNGQDPDSVNLDDMCDSSTKLGDPKPPTMSFTGFVNREEEGFRNIIRASLESPKATRVGMILYPDAEYVIGEIEIGAISVSAAKGQGLSYSGTGTFTEVPTYSWEQVLA